MVNEFDDYDKWSIDNMTPAWIESADWNGQNSVTLKCAAYNQGNETITAVRNEVEAFRVIESKVITNDDLYAGGTDLQVDANGKIVTITNGAYTWSGAITIHLS